MKLTRTKSLISLLLIMHLLILVIHTTDNPDPTSIKKVGENDDEGIDGVNEVGEDDEVVKEDDEVVKEEEEVKEEEVVKEEVVKKEEDVRKEDVKKEDVKKEEDVRKEEVVKEEVKDGGEVKEKKEGIKMEHIAMAAGALFVLGLLVMVILKMGKGNRKNVEPKLRDSVVVWRVGNL